MVCTAMGTTFSESQGAVKHAHCRTRRRHGHVGLRVINDVCAWCCRYSSSLHGNFPRRCWTLLLRLMRCASPPCAAAQHDRSDTRGPTSFRRYAPPQPSQPALPPQHCVRCSCRPSSAPAGRRPHKRRGSSRAPGRPSARQGTHVLQQRHKNGTARMSGSTYAWRWRCGKHPDRPSSDVRRGWPGWASRPAQHTCITHHGGGSRC